MERTARVVTRQKHARIYCLKAYFERTARSSRAVKDEMMNGFCPAPRHLRMQKLVSSCSRGANARTGRMQSGWEIW